MAYKIAEKKNINISINNDDDWRKKNLWMNSKKKSCPIFNRADEGIDEPNGNFFS